MARPFTRLALTFGPCLILAGFTLSPADAQQATPPPGQPVAAGAQPADNPEALLSRRIPEIDLSEAALQDAIDQLADFANTNIVVMWNRLRDLGIDRDQPITLSVRNLRFQQVLWLILDQAASQDVRLACRIEPNLIIISSADDLGREMIVRTYDIEDLLASRLRRPTLQIGRVHDYVAGTGVTVAQGAVAVTPVIGRVAGGVELIGEDVLGDTYVNQATSDDERERYIRQLMAVIVSTIEPDSWAENGGPGSIREFKGMLVIRNSPFVHQLIGGPLRQP